MITNLIQEHHLCRTSERGHDAHRPPPTPIPTKGGKNLNPPLAKTPLPFKFPPSLSHPPNPDPTPLLVPGGVPPTSTGDSTIVDLKLEIAVCSVTSAGYLARWRL